MAMPQAIQQQVEQAEALQAQIYSEAPATPPVEAQPVPTESAPEAPVSNVVELPKPAEPTPPVETPKATEHGDDVSYWKKRFETVQGKLNAEMPQLYQRIKEQDQKLQDLTRQLQERASTPAKSEELVTDKDVEAYGADLIDMTRRVAAEAVSKAIAQAMGDFRKEVGAVQAQVGQVSEKVVQSEEDRFWGRVMSVVPDWKAIDANPEWIEWLNTAPPFSKRSYRQLAGEAIAAGDPQAIAALVEAWRGPQARPVAPPSIPNPKQPNPELQRQVTPSNSKSSAVVQPAERIWSRADYEAAMDVRNATRLGKIEAEKLEAEANRAVAEGRVRW